MNECTYKSFDELPLILNVVQVRCWASPAPERMS